MPLLRHPAAFVAASLLMVALLPAPGRVPSDAPGVLPEPTASLRQAPRPDPVRRVASREPVEPVHDSPTPEATPAPVPLDRLLRVPAGVPLHSTLPGAGRFGSPENGLAERPGSRRPGPRLRIVRRSERLSAAPRIGSVEQAEIGVAVPLEDSVQLRGGVRLDRRRTDDGPQDWENATPSVGLEWTF